MGNKKEKIDNIKRVISLMVLIIVYISIGGTEEYTEKANDTGGVQEVVEIIMGEVTEETDEKDDLISGKRISTIGDSISYNDKKNNGEGGVFIGYQSLLERDYDIPEIINRSITGAAMAEGTRNGLGLSKAYEEDNFTDTDIMIIFSGTNDFRLDVELGNYYGMLLKEKNMETFYGAYSNMVEKIIGNNPEIELILWTPLKRDNAGYSVSTKNEAGYYLEDYRDAIIDIAEFYKVNYCDMYSDSGIEIDNLDELTTDGLHLNNKGYEVLYGQVENCLQEIGRE